MGARFPDVSGMDGITVSLRNAGGTFSGYKIAFCDSHINLYRCQFGTFKADLPVPLTSTSSFQDVFVPWSAFSDKWNAATGKHTAEELPKRHLALCLFDNFVVLCKPLWLTPVRPLDSANRLHLFAKVVLKVWFVGVSPANINSFSVFGRKTIFNQSCCCFWSQLSYF